MIYDSNDRYIDELEEENMLLRKEIEDLKKMNFKLEISDESANTLMKDILRDDLFSLRQQMNSMRLQIAAGEKIPEYQLDDLKDWTRWHEALMTLTEYYFTESERKQFEIGPKDDVEDSVGC